MVSIRRFVIPAVLIGCVTLSGCANTRSRLSAMLGGRKQAFSDSIVDNRDLPKSAADMADSVQDSLKDSVDNASKTVADVGKKVTDPARKRYTRKSNTGGMDTHIDDVIARAKSRGKQAAQSVAKSATRDFPEDPFLNDFDEVAQQATAAASEKAKDVASSVASKEESVFDRLEAAKARFNEKQNSFADSAKVETQEVAERLIPDSNAFAALDQPVEQMNDSVAEMQDTIADSVSELNPFEELDTDVEVATAADLPIADTKTNDVPTADEIVDVLQSFDEPPAAVVADTTAPTEFDALPDFDFDKLDEIEPAAMPEKVVEPVAVAAAPKPKKPLSVMTTTDRVSDFDELFADATSTVKTPEETESFRDTRFQPTSARRPGSARKQRSVPAAIASDDMIIDSNELPQRPISEPTRFTSRDDFTPADRRSQTHDDFFEADYSVRANEPGEAVKTTPNDFSFESPAPTTPDVNEFDEIESLLPSADEVIEKAPEMPSSPFEEFEEFDDGPVAVRKTDMPLRLASARRTGEVVPVANSVSANRGEKLAVANPFALESTQPTTESTPTLDLLNEPASYKATSSPGQLPTIVPGTNVTRPVEQGRYATTQTPLENVAWEVEPAQGVSADAGHSPWIAWIAVALCSIALILLLRPATNRI